MVFQAVQSTFMDTDGQQNTFTVNVPESARPFIDAAVERDGFADRDAFIAKLLEGAQLRAEQERFEAEMMKGINRGPPEPVTDETFATDREEFDRRLAERPAQ